ncbi:MAG: Ig-like domain-containing protein, partial [Bacilli bacterium]|nr:Ig-like domain-containing protein [Bacilli bacterium]
DIDCVRNTNYLIGEYSGGEYYNPYSIGGKTGNLMVAGRCLITISQKGDFEVLAITLGVPNEAGNDYDYHLVDHNILFEYAFSSYTENITIDIGPLYRSVEKDKKIKIDVTTSKDTDIIWTSSNPEVASVDRDGVVTGISQGQAKIVATTETGNLAYTFVSVDFYNGVHTKYSTGPANDQNGWDPIDYSIIKDKGFDYVMIRAGYGGTTMDKTFLANIRNAVDNGLNVGIWYEGYAKTKEEAIEEANHLISILNEIKDLKEKVNLPVLYNLLYSECSDPEILYEMIASFQEIIKQDGYDVMLELGKTKLSKMELQKLDELGVPVSIIYRSILPNYQETMKANDKEADIWNYKANAYLEKGLGQNASFSLLYMRFKKLVTIHQEYVEEIENETSFEENLSNTVSTNSLSHTLNLVDTLDKKEVQITVGNPTILKNPVKREKSNPINDVKDKKINSIFIILPIFILITGFIIGFLYLKKSNES